MMPANTDLTNPDINASTMTLSWCASLRSQGDDKPC